MIFGSNLRSAINRDTFEKQKQNSWNYYVNKLISTNIMVLTSWRKAEENDIENRYA